MACFIVPGTEAIVTTLATKIIEKREEQKGLCAENGEITVSEQTKERFSTKLKKLNCMLWGGSALLAFEHVWHGEVQPFFPFLTAAGNAEDAVEMLHEMSTVGVAMAVAVTVVWGIMTVVARNIENRKESSLTDNQEA